MTSWVPFAKASISKIPKGPFQTIVLAFASVSQNSFTVLGPISTAILPSGIESPTISAVASAAMVSTTTLSMGSSIVLFMGFAFSRSDFANSRRSASNFDLPIDFPCALRNVYAMPPPIMIVSHLGSTLSINLILSDTLAPPRITIKGLWGFSTALPRYSISFSRRNPAADCR